MTNVSRRITLKKNYILALFAGLLFLSFVFVNIGSGLLLGRQKLDLTGDGRYTLSEASRRIVSEINSPLYIRFYLSSAVSGNIPPFTNIRRRFSAGLKPTATKTRK